MHGTTNI